MMSALLTVVVQAAILAAPEKTYSEAYQKSLDTGRPLVVLLGAEWCPACLVMKHTTIPQISKDGALNSVEFVYIDVDRQPDLANRLALARSLPQLIRFEKKSDTWARTSLIGAQTVETVATFVKGASPEVKSVAQKSSPVAVAPAIPNDSSAQLSSLPKASTGETTK